MPNRGNNCKSPVAESCNSCDPGYRLKQVNDHTSICLKNQCKCKNGHPSSGTDCKINGSYRCVSCTADHFLRVNHAQSLCFACPKGHHRNEYDDQFSCSANECGCLNGVGTSKNLCEINGENNCFGCDFGYHLVETGTDETEPSNSSVVSKTTPSSVCKPNECNCDNGASGIGIDCPSHDSEWCLDCLPGFLMDITSDYMVVLRNYWSLGRWAWTKVEIFVEIFQVISVSCYLVSSHFI